jgi:hypothetical protein
MIKALFAVSVGAAVVLMSGCGTAWNFVSNANGPTVYGGVQRDIEFIMTPASTSPGGTWQEFTNEEGLVIFALIPAEVCLSFVADSLTLPLVVYLQHREYCRDHADKPMSSGKPASLGGDSATGSSTQLE